LQIGTSSITAVGHIQARQIILWLDYRSSKFEFFYGSGVGQEKRVDALENLVKYLPEPTFWGLPRDFNPLFSLLSGMAWAIGELQIPPRFYNPDLSDYNPFLEIVLMASAPMLVTANALAPDGFLKDLGVVTEKYTLRRMEVAFICGFWNGLMNQAKAIPDLGAKLVELTSNRQAARDTLFKRIDTFKADANKEGGYWNLIASICVEKYEHANACQRAAGAGEVISNLLTIPLAIAKVGSLAKLGTALNMLDPMTLLFKAAAPFAKYAYKNGSNAISGAFKLGSGAVRTTLEGGKIVFKIIRQAGGALEKVDWKIAKVAILQTPDGRLVPMLVLTGSDPLTSALTKCKENCRDR
jgi:hypothetical protein